MTNTNNKGLDSFGPLNFFLLVSHLPQADLQNLIHSDQKAKKLFLDLDEESLFTGCMRPGTKTTFLIVLTSAMSHGPEYLVV